MHKYLAFAHALSPKKLGGNSFRLYLISKANIDLLLFYYNAQHNREKTRSGGNEKGAHHEGLDGNIIWTLNIE